MDENTGRIEFVDPPRFDVPQGSDGDNRYDLMLRVFDGVNDRDYDLTVTVQPAGKMNRGAGGFQVWVPAFRQLCVTLCEAKRRITGRPSIVWSVFSW